MRRSRRFLTAAVLAVAAVLLAGAGAYAVLTGRDGSTTEQQHFRHQTTAWSTSANFYINVATAYVDVTIPDDTRGMMIDARYSAESSCTGQAGGWCSVRIVVTTPQGLVALDPQSGADFAFDAAGSDRWESHAMERTSTFLPPGNYRVRVQARTVGADRIRLDDWTLAVALINP